jgi:uncharacterized protein YjbJ (UPF0337 family)
MDKGRIVGSTEDSIGKVERTVGDKAGDTKAAGVRQAAGKVENLYGQAKDAARNATDYAKQVYRQMA